MIPIVEGMTRREMIDLIDPALKRFDVTVTELTNVLTTNPHSGRDLVKYCHPNVNNPRVFNVLDMIMYDPIEYYAKYKPNLGSNCAAPSNFTDKLKAETCTFHTMSHPGQCIYPYRLHLGCLRAGYHCFPPEDYDSNMFRNEDSSDTTNYGKDYYDTFTVPAGFAKIINRNIRTASRANLVAYMLEIFEYYPDWLSSIVLVRTVFKHGLFELYDKVIAKSWSWGISTLWSSSWVPSTYSAVIVHTFRDYEYLMRINKDSSDDVDTDKDKVPLVPIFEVNENTPVGDAERVNEFD